MTTLKQAKHIYLMGIKGVAMTSLAQILIDDGKIVSGCDVKQDFVTHKQLDKLPVKIDQGFDCTLEPEIEVVVYTSAHGGPDNPIVNQARDKNLLVLSQAEAVAQYFNQKEGVAVCGVGGKSTVSAMITWILKQTGREPSFSVGVGDIIGLNKTGQWNIQSDNFICEADEYVVDKKQAEEGNLVPRFSFLQPQTVVATNLAYDHPDVYPSFEKTKQVFAQFFNQIKQFGNLIINGDDQDLMDIIQLDPLATKIKQEELDLIKFGETTANNWRLLAFSVETGFTRSQLEFEGQTYHLKLQIPGKYNVLNALAAIAACTQLGVKPEESIEALYSFKSTMRRFEQVGIVESVIYYDDYAHHPHELKAVIQALAQWHPNVRRVIAFQPHTYSRTKQLFDQFVEALAAAQEVILIDIFSSAREKYDPTVSSDLLAKAVKEKCPQLKISNLKTIQSLADFAKNQLKAGDALMTVGAGDIYQVHRLIKQKS